MRHGPAGIGLEGDGIDDPARAQLIEQRAEIGFLAWRKGLIEAVLPLEDEARAGEACLGEERCADAGLGRPAGMETLGPAAIREIFDDPRGEAAGDADGMGDAL